MRGSLPDQAFRPSIKACDGDRDLVLLLGRGRLVVAESEFNRWRDAEKRKRECAVAAVEYPTLARNGVALDGPPSRRTILGKRFLGSYVRASGARDNLSQSFSVG